MSDETRTVTVAGLAAARHAIVQASIALANESYVEAHHEIERALAALAALPVATAGPEPGETLRASGEEFAAVYSRARYGWRLDDLDAVKKAIVRREAAALLATDAAALQGAAAQADGGEPPVDVGRLTRALAEIRDGAYDQNDECQWCGWDYGEGHGPDCPAEAAARALTDPLSTPDPNP